MARWYEELLCHVEDGFPARTPVDDVFDDDGMLLGFRVFATPGHTEGSVMLHHETTGTLFSGDAILAGPPPLRAIERLTLAVPGFSLRTRECHEAVKGALRRLPRTRTLCAGHGPAVQQSVETKLRRLMFWPS
jgi:glyoxylase-like metal-dependent hydrolase (beta-lactamase superfamily II)